MAKKVTKNNWVYEYESAPKYRMRYDCELTDIRYILGEIINPEIKKTLLCIGINPSTAMPEQLDPTLLRVQKYAKENGMYGAWYMLNIYPQRATNPQNMDTDETLRKEIHSQNIKSIRNLIRTLEEIDVWCAWGAIINDNKRKFLCKLLYGYEQERITGILSLLSLSNTKFKAYGATKGGEPSHPLVMPKEAILKDIDTIPKLQQLTEKINSIILK